MSTNTHSTFDNGYDQLSIRFDKSHHCLWSFMDQKQRVPCFNYDLMDEIQHHQNQIERSNGFINWQGEQAAIKYVVAASLTPNCFNLGGELALAYKLIKDGNRTALSHYAMKCIDVLSHRIFKFNNPNITTISLLQGKTLGGGLEAALTSDVVIAEKGTMLGFPEILFNLFPGMGGYSLLSRKLGEKLADEFMTKGKIYTAEQAYELGLVDVLAENGEGEHEVYKWIEKNNRSMLGQIAYKKVKNVVNPITYQELVDIVSIWVDTAFQLSEHDLSIMHRLAQRQEMTYIPEVEHTELEKTA